MVIVVLVVHSSTWKVRLLVDSVRLCVFSGRTSLNVVTFHLIFTVSTNGIEEILRGRWRYLSWKIFVPLLSVQDWMLKDKDCISFEEALDSCSKSLHWLEFPLSILYLELSVKNVAWGEKVLSSTSWTNEEKRKLTLNHDVEICDSMFQLKPQELVVDYVCLSNWQGISRSHYLLES